MSRLRKRFALEIPEKLENAHTERTHPHKRSGLRFCSEQDDGASGFTCVAREPRLMLGQRGAHPHRDQQNITFRPRFDHRDRDTSSRPLDRFRGRNGWLRIPTAPASVYLTRLRPIRRRNRYLRAALFDRRLTNGFNCQIRGSTDRCKPWALVLLELSKQAVFEIDNGYDPLPLVLHCYAKSPISLRQFFEFPHGGSFSSHGPELQASSHSCGRT